VKGVETVAVRKETESKVASKRKPPATTPEARENQLIALAYDAAEKQMQEGTASAQVVSHFLKLGSSREKLEQLRLAGEVELQKAKMEQLASEARVEELYAQAIKAMRNYSGNEGVLGDDQDDDYY
jgi:hypothetical protein